MVFGVYYFAQAIFRLDRKSPANRFCVWLQTICIILTVNQNSENIQMNIEKTDHKKRIKTLWIISLLLIPISVISYLYLFLVFFAGGLFMSDFEVVNKTDTPVRVSPYGKIFTSETASLPIYFNCIPYLQKIQSSRFLIKPKESIKITYDTDDSFFEGIIIEADNVIKDCRQANFEIVDGKIIIEKIQSLPDADKLLMEKVFKFRYKNVILYFLFLIGITNLFLFLILIGIRKRNKKLVT